MPVTSRHIILRANNRRSAPPHTWIQATGQSLCGASDSNRALDSRAPMGHLGRDCWWSVEIACGYRLCTKRTIRSIRRRDMGGSCQPREAKDCALQVYRFWWLIDDQWQKCGLLASRDHVMASAYASPYLICHRKPPLLLHLPDWSRLTNADLIAPRS
jgi:hypothetical protein